MFKSKVVPEDRTFSTLVSLAVASAYLCFASTEATTVLSTVKEVGVLALCYQAQLPSITPMKTTSAQPSKRSLARNVLLLIVCVLLWHRTLDATSNLFARSSLFRQPAEKNATSVMFEHQQSASSSLHQPDYAVLEDPMYDNWDIETSSMASPKTASHKKRLWGVSTSVSRMGSSRGTTSLLKVATIRNTITNVTLGAIKLPLKQFRQTAVAFQLGRQHATNKLSNVWPALKQIWAVALVATVVQVTSEAFWLAATISIRALLNYQEMLELRDWNQLSSSMMASVPAKGLRRYYQDKLGHFSDTLVVKKLRRIFSIPAKALLRCRDMLERFSRLVTRRLASFRI